MRVLVVMSLAALGIAADAPDEAAKKDLAGLRGTWALASAQRDGKALPAEEVKKTRITFDGDRFAFPDASGIGTSKKGTIRIDPGKKPKQMDAASSEGETSLGIYELDGDDYKVCFAPPGKPRPEAFASKPGTGHILQV